MYGEKARTSILRGDLVAPPNNNVIRSVSFPECEFISHRRAKKRNRNIYETPFSPYIDHFVRDIKQRRKGIRASRDVNIT